MRLAIVGSESIQDANGLYLLIDRFIYHHGSKNLTIISESLGEVARVVEKFAYARGYNFINLPFKKVEDVPPFLSNVDKVLAFVEEGDLRLESMLKRSRKNGIPVMTIRTNEEPSLLD